MPKISKLTYIYFIGKEKLIKIKWLYQYIIYYIYVIYDI